MSVMCTADGEGHAGDGRAGGWAGGCASRVEGQAVGWAGCTLGLWYNASLVMYSLVKGLASRQWARQRKARQAPPTSCLPCCSMWVVSC